MAQLATNELLDAIFGEGAPGASVAERARVSSRQFVRSVDHLAFYVPEATGRKLSAFEAFQSFGLNKLLEVLEFGSAILIADKREPSKSFLERRKTLNLNPYDVAKHAGVTKAVLADAERAEKRPKVRDFERIAQALAIDENQIGHEAGSFELSQLAQRLKQVRDRSAYISSNIVLSFAEAAWIIQWQYRLQGWLGIGAALQTSDFETDSRYGDREFPAWHYGYGLAEVTRRKLGIAPLVPILSLRNVVERQLGIPLIHLDLHTSVAGATIATGRDRGIAVNIKGMNDNVWVRRSTIAHELGHLLWDPDQQLNHLRVDTFDELDAEPPQIRARDFVESRANAFAIEFLAPRVAVSKIVRDAPNISFGLRQVMEIFGVSFTAAKYQVWNAFDRNIPFDNLRVDDVRPTDDWIGRESFTMDYFHIRDVKISRRGIFSGLVAKAAAEGIISYDSGGALLGCSSTELETHALAIAEMFFDSRQGLVSGMVSQDHALLETQFNEAVEKNKLTPGIASNSGTVGWTTS